MARYEQVATGRPTREELQKQEQDARNSPVGLSHPGGGRHVQRGGAALSTAVRGTENAAQIEKVIQQQQADDARIKEFAPAA